VGRIEMLVAVEFDYQAAAIGDEVADVAAERLLATPPTWEVEPEVLPQDHLRIGEVGSELLGAIGSERVAGDSGHLFWKVPHAGGRIKRSGSVSLLPPQGGVPTGGRGGGQSVVAIRV